MGFIKIREYKANEETIINTEMITLIHKGENKKGEVFYEVSFPGKKDLNGWPMCITVDAENIQKIFDEIGLEL